MVDEELLKGVVGETDDFDSFGVPEVEGGNLAVGNPLLSGLRTLAPQDLHALLDDFLYALGHLRQSITQ